VVWRYRGTRSASVCIAHRDAKLGGTLPGFAGGPRFFRFLQAAAFTLVWYGIPSPTTDHRPKEIERNC